MVIEGDSHPDRVIEKTNSRLPAGKRSPCRDVAVVRSLLVLRCSREQNALHTLNPPASLYAIMRRACSLPRREPWSSVKNVSER